MNENLDGRRLPDIKISARTVLIFEAGSGGPPAGGSELLPQKPRGRGGYIIGFLDSHVECVTPERLDELIWLPDVQKQPYDIIR